MKLLSNDFQKNFERDAARKNERYTRVSRKFFLAIRQLADEIIKKALKSEFHNS